MAAAASHHAESPAQPPPAHESQNPNPPAKEDTWAFQPVGSPFPDNSVMAIGQQNQYIALWYKNGKPLHGRAWNNDGVVECSFPYINVELKSTDLAGHIQVLQYKGDHNTLGYWYEWIKYKDRFEKPEDRQWLRCGDSIPLFWKDRKGGPPLCGYVDNKTEVAKFSHDGVSETITGAALSNMMMIVRNVKGGPPFCECWKTGGSCPKPSPSPPCDMTNECIDFRACEEFPKKDTVRALDKSLNILPGQNPDQYVDKALNGRATNSDGAVECSLPYITVELKFTDLAGHIQMLQYKGDYNTLCYWYEWIKCKDRKDRQSSRCAPLFSKIINALCGNKPEVNSKVRVLMYSGANQYYEINWQDAPMDLQYENYYYPMANEMIPAQGTSNITVEQLQQRSMPEMTNVPYFFVVPLPSRNYRMSGIYFYLRETVYQYDLLRKTDDVGYIYLCQGCGSCGTLNADVFRAEGHRVFCCQETVSDFRSKAAKFLAKVTPSTCFPLVYDTCKDRYVDATIEQLNPDYDAIIGIKFHLTEQEFFVGWNRFSYYIYYVLTNGHEAQYGFDGTNFICKTCRGLYKSRAVLTIDVLRIYRHECAGFDPPTLKPQLINVIGRPNFQLPYALFKTEGYFEEFENLKNNLYPRQ